MRIPKIIQFCVVTAVFYGIISGCTGPISTRPSDPYRGPLPDSFYNLEQKNLLLATELAKLPEIHDGISDSEKVALEKMGQLYLSDPDTFDAAFNRMYRIGKPAVRKYCSPLQAMFWLIADGKLTAQNNPLNNYSFNRVKNGLANDKRKNCRHFDALLSHPAQFCDNMLISRQ